ncbi:MAG: hypothetical protein QMD05_01300 [Candidatus Brocadiaceae bacterium]|nr:hypothetical protein [Candidatus Brocadiaceae bacterium]
MKRIKWDIRHKGHAWKGEAAKERLKLIPEKIEMFQGKLFWSDKERLNMLGLLLENVGIDKAIRFGEPKMWREAVAELEE